MRGKVPSELGVVTSHVSEVVTGGYIAILDIPPVYGAILGELYLTAFEDSLYLYLPVGGIGVVYLRRIYNNFRRGVGHQ